MVTVEELLACIDDPDDDSTRACELVRQLAVERDRFLLPGLTKALRGFLAADRFYGRDVIADALVAIDGVEALPVLIAAASVDLGDDQDWLSSTMVEAMWLDLARADEILQGLRATDAPRTGKTVAWAMGTLDYLKSRR